MSLFPRIALVLVLFLSSSFAFSSDYQSGEVIVKYKEGALRLQSNMNFLYDSAGVDKVRYFSGLMKDFEHLVLNADVSIEEAIGELEKNPVVEYAQPNYILTIPELAQMELPKPQGGVPCFPGLDIPDCDPDLCWVPGLPLPPGCKDSGGGGPGNPPANRPELQEPPGEVIPPEADPDLDKAWGIAKIKADETWSDHRGGKEFVVAVIDTGVDYNHEDLSFNMWRNPNPTQDDIVGFDFIHNDGLPYDDQGHGTHTSGTVGAVGGNGKGVSGVAQHVSIMGLKFLTSQGSGTTADAIRAIDYAVENGAKVLSNSWGGRGINNQALKDSIGRANEAGVLFIAAAGNDGANNDSSNASYPAAFDNENIIAVAASDQNDALASFSNYGAVSTDVAAPGVNVYSLLPGNKYKAHSGTSMACPHVAGAAALIWSKNPDLTSKQVKQIIMESVDAVPAFAGKMVTGGRINVQRALSSME